MKKTKTKKPLKKINWEKKLITIISTLKESKSGYPFVVVFGKWWKQYKVYFGQKLLH